MLEMFSAGFMQRAWIAGLIVAVICPLIGSFLVLRRQSMIGDGLGHIAFAGVAGGALLGGAAGGKRSTGNRCGRTCYRKSAQQA